MAFTYPYGYDCTMVVGFNKSSNYYFFNGNANTGNPRILCYSSDTYSINNFYDTVTEFYNYIDNFNYADNNKPFYSRFIGITNRTNLHPIGFTDSAALSNFMGNYEPHVPPLFQNNNGSFFWSSFSYYSWYFYSNSNELPLLFFSYESMYNYAHGSQNAYLSSKVEEAGEDIKLSINDMNDNIGSKIDDLIDSINNKKEGMSADELQDAIDKALDSISGKIDNIGDNTEETNNKLDALLEAASSTNQILMQILGVTTDIRDVVKTKDEEGNQYTMNDVKDCFNTMYNNLKYSILYGKNVSNNPDAANASTAAYVSYSNISTYADTTTSETLDYKDGLFGKFPFSVPYQMYEWLQVLQTEEMVPQFTYNYGFLIGQKGKQEYDLTFDLSAYQSWADVLKSFLRLSFTLIMSVFIYNKFKGEI